MEGDRFLVIDRDSYQYQLDIYAFPQEGGASLLASHGDWGGLLDHVVADEAGISLYVDSGQGVFPRGVSWEDLGFAQGSAGKK